MQGLGENQQGFLAPKGKGGDDAQGGRDAGKGVMHNGRRDAES